MLFRSLHFGDLEGPLRVTAELTEMVPYALSPPHPLCSESEKHTSRTEFGLKKISFIILILPGVLEVCVTRESTVNI